MAELEEPSFDDKWPARRVVKKRANNAHAKLGLGAILLEEEIVTPAEMKTSEKVVYSINTNSYRIKRIAVDEVIRLKLLGFDDVYIRTDDLGEGEIWYRVMMGKFSTREDAQKVQDELIQKDAKLKSVIIRLESELTQ